MKWCWRSLAFHEPILGELRSVSELRDTDAEHGAASLHTGRLQDPLLLRHFGRSQWFRWACHQSQGLSLHLVSLWQTKEYNAEGEQLLGFSRSGVEVHRCSRWTRKQRKEQVTENKGKNTYVALLRFLLLELFPSPGQTTSARRKKVKETFISCFFLSTLLAWWVRESRLKQEARYYNKGGKAALLVLGQMFR